GLQPGALGAARGDPGRPGGDGCDRGPAGRHPGRSRQARAQGCRYPRTQEPGRPRGRRAADPRARRRRARRHRSGVVAAHSRGGLAVSTTPSRTVPEVLRHARIHGVGGYRPERVVTNEEICRTIDSSDEWIRQRSGIVTRRFARADESVIDMSEIASRRALENAGVSPEQIGVVIMATVTHPYQTPAAAPELAHRLGIPDPAAFDISAACAGYCHGISLAND